LGDLANAVLFYQKAQTEHRTPEVLAKLRAAEKAKITQEKESYINPEEAEKARELGNAKFKESDWPAAVEAYSEMIKRAPEDPRGYSNRAACFIKLLEFPSAVQDCDEAIKRDPDFIRAYLRKAQAYFTMREYSKCADVCAEAAAHDKDGKNAREIQQQETKALQAQYSAREGETEQQTMERIQRDPEVRHNTYSKPQLLTYCLDRQHSARPHYEQHSPAGQGGPSSASRASQEPRHPYQGTEVGTCRCHPYGSIKNPSLFFYHWLGLLPVWYLMSTYDTFNG
jgi:tetratricopeptide (TPR) repeat protein